LCEIVGTANGLCFYFLFGNNFNGINIYLKLPIPKKDEGPFATAFGFFLIYYPVEHIVKKMKAKEMMTKSLFKFIDQIIGTAIE
jgi:hypothetical protein